MVRGCRMRSANRQHDVPLLSKYTTAATASAVLGNCTLRWNSPKLFNDPFDVPRDMDLGFTFDDLRRAMVGRVDTYLEGEAVPGSEAGLTLLTAMKSRRDIRRSVLLEDLGATLVMAAVPSLVSMEQLRTVWRARVPGLRILCFSEVADSPPMWAHYADDHRDVVLQFESNDERDSCWLLARSDCTTAMRRSSAPPVSSGKLFCGSGLPSRSLHSNAIATHSRDPPFCSPNRATLRVTIDVREVGACFRVKTVNNAFGQRG